MNQTYATHILTRARCIDARVSNYMDTVAIMAGWCITPNHRYRKARHNGSLVQRAWYLGDQIERYEARYAAWCKRVLV